MKDIIKGKAYVVKDDVNTDYIIPARYMNTMDAATLAKHAMEDLDPKEYPAPFLNADKTCDYKIIVAGKNFGCGSSREHAPIALHGAGVEAVIATTFARIYYRNSVNGGIILPLESALYLPNFIKTGEEIEIRLSGNAGEITKLSQKQNFMIKPFGPVKDIIEAGGLTAYNKKRLNL